MTGVLVSPVEAKLQGLASHINEEHALCEQSLRAGLQHAINAGKLLIEAKAFCGHGDWGKWLQANCNVSKRTSQLYMRICNRLPVLEAKAQHVADLSLRDAVRLLTEPTQAPEVSMMSREEAERAIDSIRSHLIEMREAVIQVRASTGARFEEELVAALGPEQAMIFLQWKEHGYDFGFMMNLAGDFVTSGAKKEAIT